MSKPIEDGAIDFAPQWEQCIGIIKNNVSEAAFKTWFKPIKPISFKDGVLAIWVPSQFFAEFLDEHYLEVFRVSIYRAFGEGTELEYKTDTGADEKSDGEISMRASERTILHQPQKTIQIRELPQAPQTDIDPRLNPESNFTSFIEGNSNKLARSVSEAAAKEPGKTIFNPLFIYGASGVGKTHLANAIGLKTKELHPELRVLYVSAHLFQVQYTDSVRNNTTNDFINFYQTIDVLIIDDIQEFAGVAKTQNTFFHIFNQLHQNNKQLIMTSDRAPGLLQGLEDRLITRFKWGMVAELERPSFDLRRDILNNHIKRNGLDFPSDVVDYIAANVTSSIRDLEGTVVSLLAHATVYNRDIDMDLAKRIVRKINNVEDKPVSVDNIVEAVCSHYGVDTKNINTRSRKRDIVQARQVAMYIAKMSTDLSTAKIGKMIGNRDHATVLHACKTIKDQEAFDKQLSADIKQIQAQLGIKR